ncbi:MAG: hypothetical protein ABSF98_18110 [Bryobacteraceae bacterium]
MASKPRVAFGLTFVGEKSAGTDIRLTAPHVVCFLPNLPQQSLHFNDDFLLASVKMSGVAMRETVISFQENDFYLLRKRGGLTGLRALPAA